MGSEILAWFVFVAAAALIGLTAAAEIAMGASNRSEIRKLSEQGDSRAAVVDDLLADPAQFWLTSMLVKSAGLVVAGVAVARIWPDTTNLLWFVVAALVAWLVLAIVQIGARARVLGSAEAVALRLAPFMRALTIMLAPVTFWLYRTGLRVSGETQEQSDESIFMNEDGLRLLMQVNEEDSNIQESEREMIVNILEMDETVAREVMVPRIDMVMMPVQTSQREALDIIIHAGHSRIPVYEGNPDVIVGLLYAKDLLQCFRDNRIDLPIRELLRPVYFVPASKKVNMLLNEMQQQRMHLAMVVDEYGGIAGLVTIEDIVEEIFGEIRDEYDVDERAHYQPIGEHSFLLNSRLAIDSLAKLLDIDLSGEDADTLGGLIYARLGHVPVQGETLEIEGWSFCVLLLDGRRIDQVRADRIPAPPSDVPASVEAPAANRKSMLKLPSMANSHTL